MLSAHFATKTGELGLNTSRNTWVMIYPPGFPQKVAEEETKLSHLILQTLNEKENEVFFARSHFLKVARARFSTSNPTSHSSLAHNHLSTTSLLTLISYA